MITLIEALDFRCLRYVSQPLAPFHVLVGPNASGKTTFLDVVAFLGDLVSEGLEKAVGERTANFDDLLWRRQGERFELAIEARIPEPVSTELHARGFDTIRYEISIGLDQKSQEIRLGAENVTLRKTRLARPSAASAFPAPGPPPKTILLAGVPSDSKKTLEKDGVDRFYPEPPRGVSEEWAPVFQLGPRRSALGNLPEDESRFPATTWLKSLLANGVQKLVLNSLAIRQASPPGQGRHYRPDGGNLPWVVDELKSKAPEKVQDWVGHLQTALPDLEGIKTIERADDKHRYLMLRYRGGVEVPSWMASDGTLRLLALTLPAYLPDLKGIFLIEEPENGIHPRAIETMYQSLSSVYGAQVLIATHSPVILSLVEARDLLCFAKDRDGATDIVLGSDHPALKKWRGETSLSTLFAAGVLGYGE